MDGGNLTISEVAEEDRGVYVCTASNAAAAVAMEAELLVENVPPRAPYNLSARAAPRSIHLSWVPGYPFLLFHKVCFLLRRAARFRSHSVRLGQSVRLRPARSFVLQFKSH